MNILYYGIIGGASHWSGWLLITWGIFLALLGIYFFLENDIKGKDFFIGVITALFCIVIGILVVIDNRKPIVKATINDTVSWQEISKDYELIEQEGEIYTFKVKNTTLEEWELKIK